MLVGATVLTDILQIFVFSTYITLVPGVPAAIYLARQTSNWRLVLALSPVLSIGGNFALLFSLNLLGVRPNLIVFGLVVTAATIVGLIRIGLPQLDELKVLLRETAPLAPAVFLGAVIWRRAFVGYLFVAPNQDSLNHNRWIARIAEVGSALGADSHIESPLQRIGSGKGFYPFAWHTTVAVGSKLSALAVPVASLISVAVIWIVVLSAGLSALAKVWSPDTRHLGALAAVLVQLYPLVPGVPLSWGSMTSCVGIALLPAGVIASAYMLLGGSRVWVGVAAVTAVTLFFVHTPEAATLVVLVLVQFLTMGGERIRKNLVRISLGVAVFLIPAVWIFRGYIFENRNALESLFGAPEPLWERAIGGFFAMNINTSLGFSVLSLVFIAGLLTASRDRRDKWVIYGVLSLFAVYLVSGAGTGFLSSLRVFTAPWYASYERTLWVVVPFAALISAYAIARLLPTNTEGGALQRAVFGAVAGVLLVVVVVEQVGPTVRQIRSGPGRAAMIGPHDLGVIEESRHIIGDGEIALGFAADGTIYPYVYEGIGVTAGLTLGRDGEPSDGIAAIMSDFDDLCASSDARSAFGTEHVAAVFLAKRGPWGVPLWTDAAARKLDGLDVVASGERLILLVPNLAECS